MPRIFIAGTETIELSCLPVGGVHSHIASDMDVRQIRVRFLALKSAKGVFLASKICKGVIFRLSRSQTSVKS